MKTRMNKVMKRTNNNRETTPTMYETENDLRKDARAELIGIINQRLADVIDLQTQLKQAHWNVKGPHFIGLHELFDKIAEEVESYVDMIAERVVQLGGIAEGQCASRPRAPGLMNIRWISQRGRPTWKPWLGRYPRSAGRRG